VYARVTTVQGSPDKAEEGVRQFREDTLPIVKGAAGFKGALLLIDRQSGKGQAISLWEDKNAMDASEDAVAGVRQSATQAMGQSGAPTVDRYEVAIYEV
jgi:heme-degrading monooxygenase HmoA